MKHRAMVQIILTEDGRVEVLTSSSNQITNLGLIGVAQAVIQKGVERKELPDSGIVVPMP